MERGDMKFHRLLGAFLLTLGISTAASTSVAANEESAGGLQVMSQSLITQNNEVFDLVLQLPGVVSDGDQITVTVHERATSEEQFLASSRGENLSGVLASQRFDVTDLQPDVWGVVKVSFFISDSEIGDIQLVQPGVYPISIEMRTRGQELVGRVITHIIRAGGSLAGQLPVVFIAQIKDFNFESTDTTGPINSWLEVLRRHPSVPLTITSHPVFIGETSFPSLAPSFTDTKHEIIRNPFTPINEAALINAGLGNEVVSLMEMGTETLATIGTLAPPTLWVGHGEADDAEVEVRWGRGTRELIVESTSLSPIPDESPRGPVEFTSSQSTFRGLVVDTLSQRHPHDTPASEAQRLLAHLATIASTDQSDPLLTVDLTANNRSPQFADVFLRGIEELNWISPLKASDAVTRSLLPGETQPRQHRLRSRLSSADQNFAGYRDARRHLAAIRSMVRDEDAEDYEALAQELLLSLSKEVPALTQIDLWESTVDLIRLQTSLIDIPPDESIQLTSQAASVPFSFQNRAGIPLRVELRIISERVTVEDFDDGESTTLVLEPGVTTHRFRLRALGSGSFPVSIELHSPDGGILVGRAQAALRATTPTGVGLGLTIGAAVFLASWWLLDTRKRKNRRL